MKVTRTKNKYGTSLTVKEVARVLTKRQKKEWISDYFHQLLAMANKEIDKGVFNEKFCPCCVVDHVLKQEREHSLAETFYQANNSN